MIKKLLINCLASSVLCSGLLSIASYANTVKPEQAQSPKTATQTATQTASRVSINAANATTLAEHLIGIGPTKAEAIVAWRAKNGRFNTVEQLLEIKGIGAATLSKNKHLITL